MTMPLTISVIGTGYLGATHAACMAELGHDVVALDVDAAKIAALAGGSLPFFDPELEELLRRHTASGRLRFTTSWDEVARDADVHFICVGTPQRDGELAADTGHVEHAVRSLVPRLRHPSLLVGKSTVPVGTAARLQELADDVAVPGVAVEVAWNPEFLREGRAVRDTLAPDRIVLGVASPGAEQVLRRVYDSFVRDAVPFLVTDPATAELVKAASNAFLATKITFANAMAELCDAAGADVVTLADAMGMDARIGRSFLGAGIGFGGGCLPKDIRALMSVAGDHGVNTLFTFLGVVDATNTHRRRSIVRSASAQCGGTVAGARIACLGAAFKPGTDDVRDSPALDIAAQLQGLGADVVVCDPRAGANAARAFPTLAVRDTVEATVEGAALVMLLTEWPEYAALDPHVLRRHVAVPRILDGRHALDPGRWRAAGWDYHAPGRPDPVTAPAVGRTELFSFSA
jgi:UDPglucose 6-dehydrogenase